MKKMIMATMTAAVLTTSGCGVGRVVGSGSKVGTVIQVSQDGWFNKTYEIEIVRGGMSNGSGNFSTKPFFATVTDADLLRKAQAAFEGQYEVKVTYTEYGNAAWASDNEDNAFLNSIEPLKK